jgi:hypothetical protein
MPDRNPTYGERKKINILFLILNLMFFFQIRKLEWFRVLRYEQIDGNMFISS